METIIQGYIDLTENIDLSRLNAQLDERNKESEEKAANKMPSPEDKEDKIQAYNNSPGFIEEPYRVKDWVVKKLQQIKNTSSLSTHTIILPDTIKIVANTISFIIKTADDQVTMLETFFYEEGTVRFKSINPKNPSKFSFDLIEQPANLIPHQIEDQVSILEDHLEVRLSGQNAKLFIKFKPFIVELVDNAENTDETLFKMNSHQSLMFDQNVAADFTFHTNYIYGIPERSHRLLLEDTKRTLPYRLFNLDIGGYSPFCKVGLYGSVPLMISRKNDSSTFVSLYWQNTSDTYVDIHKDATTSSTYWLSERGNMDFYLLLNRSSETHFKALANIFGHSAMPQYFSLGYHQSRYSYTDQKDVLEVNGKFNELEIPCDSITLDMDHIQDQFYFIWNKEKFPDPVALQEELAKSNRKLYTIANPHLKASNLYRIYNEVCEKKLYIKDKDQGMFVGACHPEKSIYFDYLNEEARDCWSSQYSYEKFEGSTPNLFAWNDMNEPTVFLTKELTMELDNIHTVKSTSEPEKAFQLEHREVHNIYSYCMNKATYKGLLERNEGQNIRPHALTRSFSTGTQKWATTWTGDSLSSWKHLKITIPMMLSVSLGGVSFCGGDVGGFLGNPEPELAVRWYQLGLFMPYFRAHSYITFKRREPWLYSTEYFEIIKQTIVERYRMLPYWYTAFEEHCRTAVPLLRPIWLEKTVISDESIMGDDERFFVGSALLAVPICEAGKTAIIDPIKDLEGRWYDYYTQKEVFTNDVIQVGLERSGCFIKGGHIIPLFELVGAVKSSKDARESKLTLYVALDNEGSARGQMYFDDGETFDYKKGNFARKSIEFKNNTLTWENQEESGFEMNNKITRVVIMGVNQQYTGGSFEVGGEGEGEDEGSVQVISEDKITIIKLNIPCRKDWRVALT